MLDNKTKEQIAYLAKRKKYEELLEEKEKLEAWLMKERTGCSPDELHKLSDYFRRTNRRK